MSALQMTDQDLFAELESLFTHRDNNDRQFNRHQMIAAMRHGMEIALTFRHLHPQPVSKCLCPQETIDKVNCGGSCHMGGCPYGGDL